MHIPLSFVFFFFNDTATTEIYTLSLHDALPISIEAIPAALRYAGLKQDDIDWFELNEAFAAQSLAVVNTLDRKSTRLNSSHLVISYAVFCLKKKKEPSSSTPLYSEHSSTAS